MNHTARPDLTERGICRLFRVAREPSSVVNSWQSGGRILAQGTEGGERAINLDRTD